jgi:hypothetical protein
MDENDIIGYKTVVNGSADSLDTSVNEWLAKGWHLYGYPYVNSNTHIRMYCQALVKYKESP